ncbi:MAG TPA: hypothetical protein VFC63_25240 [Blastocatellia bacterium]|nr:hypothetical protein [Blastocatellia bacterium]
MIEVAAKQFSVKEKDRYMLLSDALMTEIDVLSDYYFADEDESARTQRYRQIIAALKSADSNGFDNKSKTYPEETEPSASQFKALHKALIGQMKDYLRSYCQAGNEAAREEVYKSIIKALKTTMGAGTGRLTAEDELVCPEGTCLNSQGVCTQCPPGGN